MEIGFIYAIGASVTWGLAYAIDQKILAGVTPMNFLFVSSIIAAIIMLPFIFFGNGSLKELAVLDKTNWSLIILSTVLAAVVVRGACFYWISNYYKICLVFWEITNCDVQH